MREVLNAADQGFIVPVIYWYGNSYRKGYVTKENNSNSNYKDLLYNKNVTLLERDIRSYSLPSECCNDGFYDLFLKSNNISHYVAQKNEYVLKLLEKDRNQINTSLGRIDMISSTYFGLIRLFAKAFFNFYPKNMSEVKEYMEENYFNTELSRLMYNNFFNFIGFPRDGKYSWETNEIFTEKSLLFPYSQEQLNFIIRWDNEILPIMNEAKFSSFFTNFLLEHLNKDIKIIDLELSNPHILDIPGLKEDLLQAKSKLTSDKTTVNKLSLKKSFYYKNKDDWYKLLPTTFKPLIESQFDNLNFLIANRSLYTMNGFIDKIEVNMTSYF